MTYSTKTVSFFDKYIKVYDSYTHTGILKFIQILPSTKNYMHVQLLSKIDDTMSDKELEVIQKI